MSHRPNRVRCAAYVLLQAWQENGVACRNGEGRREARQRKARRAMALRRHGMYAERRRGAIYGIEGRQACYRQVCVVVVAERQVRW